MVSYFFIKFATSKLYRKPPGLEEGQMTFTYKGVPLRFGFDRV